MSIKGTSKELFVGKEEINLITFIGNKITIPYSVMKGVNYSYASRLKTGFLLFKRNDNTNIRFDFGYSVNEKITQTINFINEHQPWLETKEFDINEFKNNRSASLTPISGYKELGLSSLTLSIHQRVDGSIYFNSDTSKLYTISSYEWNGPEYDVVTNTSANVTGKNTTKKQGKALKIGAGALLGNLVAPGVGTLVGAAMGAGSKGKEKTKGHKTTNSQQIEKKVENSTIAFLTLINIDTRKVYKISFKCDTKLDAALRCFDIVIPDSKESIVIDTQKSLEDIKVLKELLDMGAITQDEFDTKKKQLLR
ncbi:SHOCT domain-containing protein [[Clostridium] symbiosum]|uniref:SHOCT domain-containing protein n=1 Tax=Clostridium symbiosum TaxID=1512 RepID=UPI0018974044|nr:SHOCT domain-containing protein [[Clostridium] symbiosum]MDB2016770.1 SHOCT domain-containing protein [[Clostridium] symbiosum]MDB2033959.1 SHOCT domain-containing protein [[Clostridium] symbiosum]